MKESTRPTGSHCVNHGVHAESARSESARRPRRRRAGAITLIGVPGVQARVSPMNKVLSVELIAELVGSFCDDCDRVRLFFVDRCTRAAVPWTPIARDWKRGSYDNESQPRPPVTAPAFACGEVVEVFLTSLPTKYDGLGGFEGHPRSRASEAANLVSEMCEARPPVPAQCASDVWDVVVRLFQSGELRVGHWAIDNLAAAAVIAGRLEVVEWALPVVAAHPERECELSSVFFHVIDMAAQHRPGEVAAILERLRAALPLEEWINLRSSLSMVLQPDYPCSQQLEVARSLLAAMGRPEWWADDMVARIAEIVAEDAARKIRELGPDFDATHPPRPCRVESHGLSVRYRRLVREDPSLQEQYAGLISFLWPSR